MGQMDWQIVLILHAAATWYMTGLVAAVQAFHYPALAEAAEDRRVFEAHVRRAGPVIAPVMLFEAGSGLALLASPLSGPLLQTAFGLLALIWISTFAIQVPLHRSLCGGQCADRRAAARRLVATNWIRTAAWAARAGLVTAALIEVSA